MILVAGATGQLGRLITETLLSQKEQVRALTRPESDIGWLHAAGAESVVGDLKDPYSLDRACAGVDTVISTVTSMARGGADTIESVDRAGNRSLIDAARKQGVRRFVFISALGANPASPMPLLRAKGETENYLRDSGMTWTVLRPNAYMDRLLMDVIGTPALEGSPVTLVGDCLRRHSLIALDDVATYAIAILRHRAADNRVLELGGPEAVSWREAVGCFEDQLEYPIDVHTVAAGDSIPGMPAFLVQLLTAMARHDSPVPMSDLETTYGVVPTTLADFVRRTESRYRVHGVL